MKTKLYLFFLAIMLVFSACKKSNSDNSIPDLCDLEQDMNAGIIEELLAIDCVIEMGTVPEPIVVKEQSTWDQYAQTCNETFPAIDFTNYSVIATTTGATGCDQYYYREVEQVDAESKIIYHIDVFECGGCEPWVRQTHWVKIPKIPEGYEIEVMVL